MNPFVPPTYPSDQRIRAVMLAYEEAFGRVPPSLPARFAAFSGRQLDAMIAFEEARLLAVLPTELPQRWVQLIQFALYTALGERDGATVHGAAALERGCSPQELGVATHLAFLAAGMPALLLGVEVINSGLNSED